MQSSYSVLALWFIGEWGNTKGSMRKPLLQIITNDPILIRSIKNVILANVESLKLSSVCCLNLSWDRHNRSVILF